MLKKIVVNEKLAVEIEINEFLTLNLSNIYMRIAILHFLQQVHLYTVASKKVMWLPANTSLLIMRKYRVSNEEVRGRVGETRKLSEVNLVFGMKLSIRGNNYVGICNHREY